MTNPAASPADDLRPEANGVGRADGSGVMFDHIAPRYDLMNRLMSVGMDRRWRRRQVERLALTGSDEVLDVATGTADVAIAVASRYRSARIIGVDPSEGMLAIGRQKVREAGYDERIHLVAGDAQSLPFADARFAATCMSFGIRNVPDRPQALREMARVTCPGGIVAILELGEPDAGAIAAAARFYVHHVIPRLGGLLAGTREYRYLQQSIAAFPRAAVFAQTMTDAGLRMVDVERFSFGAANLFIAQKRSGSAESH